MRVLEMLWPHVVPEWGLRQVRCCSCCLGALTSDVEEAIRHKLWGQWVKDIVFGHLSTVKLRSQLIPGNPKETVVLLAHLQEILPYFSE